MSVLKTVILSEFSLWNECPHSKSNNDTHMLPSSSFPIYYQLSTLPLDAKRSTYRRHVNNVQYCCVKFLCCSANYPGIHTSRVHFTFWFTRIRNRNWTATVSYSQVFSSQLNVNNLHLYQILCNFVHPFHVLFVDVLYGDRIIIIRYLPCHSFEMCTL